MCLKKVTHSMIVNLIASKYRLAFLLQLTKKNNTIELISNIT